MKKKMLSLFLAFIMVISSVISPIQIAMATTQEPITIYDMQSDPNWNSMSSATAHPIMRGTNSPSGATRVNGSPRELHILVRGGTSQGLRVRANALLNSLSARVY